MRIATLLPASVLAVLLSIGCGTEASGPATQTAAPVEPLAAVEEANYVILDAAAQRETGIVVKEVRVSALPEVIRATGRITINENQTWRVGAVTDGRIAELSVREGDPVKKGQILGRLYSHEVHEARAEYRRAVAELDRLKAGLSYAQSARNRTDRLRELKAASQQQLEQAEAELRNAETAVAHGRVELDRTVVHLEDFLGLPAKIPAGLAHNPDGEEHDLIPIISPSTGTMLTRNVTAGTVVEPTIDLFVITDLSTLWTMAAISEDYLSKLRIGMMVNVFVQAYPDRAFRGKLTKLDTELDPTTRTIMGRVEVPNSSGLLKPEMYATVELELSGSREAVFVPEIAVQEVDGEQTVFIQTGPDRFEPRSVLTARGVGGNLEIVRGLRAGDRVAVAGSFLLKSQLLKSTLAEE